MLERTMTAIKHVIRYLAGAWLFFMGSIATFMLYNELFDPQWGRQAKERFPDAVPLYMIFIVAAGAICCFFLAYKLISPKKKTKSSQQK